MMEMSDSKMKLQILYKVKLDTTFTIYNNSDPEEDLITDEGYNLIPTIVKDMVDCELDEEVRKWKK